MSVCLLYTSDAADDGESVYLGGRLVDDNEIKRILRTSDDVDERREAWEASKTVGAAVADDVRELARLRNEAARSLGYRDWFALAISTSEMDETKLFETLDECDRLTAGAFAAWKAATDTRLAERFGCAVDDLRPWHYEDPFFQDCLLYTSPSPRDKRQSRMPSSA